MNHHKASPVKTEEAFFCYTIKIHVVFNTATTVQNATTSCSSLK
jgi:hypothetical protein